VVYKAFKLDVVLADAALILLLFVVAGCRSNTANTFVLL